MTPGLQQGQEITTLPGHTGEVTGISFSPDGKYLISAGVDGTVRFYFTQIEDLIATAKKRVTRSLTTEECQRYLHGACIYLPSDFESIEGFAVYVLSSSDDPGRVKNTIERVKAELIKNNTVKSPNTEALRVVAAAIVQQITVVAATGNIETTLDLFEQARQSQIEISVDNADTLNSICWFGSLQGYSEQVLQYCETAVELAPDVAYIRDSRGLARALTGDFKGAILDFQFFVDHPNGFENAVDKRKQWIDQLKKGINPFTPEVLETLQS
jgi:hypothetical protein